MSLVACTAFGLSVNVKPRSMIGIEFVPQASRGNHARGGATGDLPQRGVREPAGLDL